MLAVLFLHRMSSKRRNELKKRALSLENNEQKTPDSIYCRTCLSTENLMSIFFSGDSDHKMSHNLKLVTGLEIKLNDGLSQKICTECRNILDNALELRRKSKRAEKTLIGMLNGNVIKPVKKRVDRKYSIDVKLSKINNTKVEQEDFDYMTEDIPYGDDFQNDNDSDCKDDVKPLKEIPYGDDFQNDNDSDCKDDVKPLKEIPYGDDFQNDNDSDCKDDVKPLKEQISSAIASNSGRRKTKKIPNAASYKCTTCNKEFRMKATYKAHMRFHTNYCVCEACGKRCRNNNQLQEHKRARHGLGRIHKCVYCEYSSATKEALTIHERRHTGERPYICDHCGATFHRRSNLVQHIAIHLPEKNFQCDMCPKKLKSKKFLQIHKHNAHTGKRYGYLCAVCAHRFEKPNKVRAHTRRVHGVPDDQQGPIQRVEFVRFVQRARSRGSVFKYIYRRITDLDDTGDDAVEDGSTIDGEYYGSQGQLRTSYKCPRCYKLFIRNEHTHRHLARVHHIPRSEHPPIERILIDNDKECGYKPLPYQCEPVYQSEPDNGFNANV